MMEPLFGTYEFAPAIVISWLSHCGKDGEKVVPVWDCYSVGSLARAAVSLPDVSGMVWLWKYGRGEDGRDATCVPLNTREFP